MNTPFRLVIFVCALALVTGCQCGTQPVSPDGGKGGGGGSSGSAGGSAQQDGGGTAGSGGGEGGGSGGSGGAGGGSTSQDAGIPVDPNDPGNAVKDSDCDGLTDAEEFGNTYAGGLHTDPANADTDGDGIKDGIEAGRLMSVDTACSYTGDNDPMTRTNPTAADSDGDGLGDGLEDTNKNGRAEPSETDALNPDTDFDGLSDGVEDMNHNGAIDTGETNPRLRDTDMDLIADGVERNVTMTNPTRADTDNDTCLDGAEDANQNGVVDPGETDPRGLDGGTDCGPSVNPDDDMDGIPNRVEDRNSNNMVDVGESNPRNADTDGDGLPDGLEDANHNGLFDPGETNATKKDTDCDGLADGPAMGMVMGEDVNSNGVLDVGETDPRRRDTDGDGLTDGVERGVTTARLADPTGCMNVPIDLNPMTTTNPTSRDTDGDGIDDGAEDVNQNGRVDMGELDPNNANDGSGPAGRVCTNANLRPVVFRPVPEADLQLGLPATFVELSPMVVAGQTKGVIGFDSVNGVAFLAWRQPAPGGATTPVADETNLRPTLAGAGALTNVTTQTFTTWDAVPALQMFADQAGTTDVKSRANALANTLVGSGAGALTGSGGGAGPFRLQLEVIHRANTGVVFVLALTRIAAFTGPALFTMSDTAGGSAVAQFGDTNAVQCETFAAGNAKVDFLLAVDDSCSMASSQGALGAAATNISAALNNSSLDWRIAMVTSSYAPQSGGGNGNAVRGFTRDINQVRSWLTNNSNCNGNNSCTGVTPMPACWGSGANGGCWIGTGGTGTEEVIQSAVRAIDTLTPATTNEMANKVRDGAIVAIILLGDADDQSGNSAAQFTTFFRTRNATLSGYTNRIGSIAVHGITCAQGKTCNNETNDNIHNTVIANTGGVRGDICEPGTGTAADCSQYPSIPNAIQNIINSIIAQAGYRMQKPPIGASVKVALSAVSVPAMCNKDDLPRSRQNGFDFDGINRTISLFGACRAPAAMGGTPAAVSYRYWIDNTANLGGGAPPCQSDMFYDPMDPDFCRGRLACNVTANVCECPQNCGGNGPPGTVCNANRLVCDFVCTADCGGTCSPYQICNTSACGCECKQSASCPVGYRFQNGAGVCGCVCDTTALNCGPTYDPDPMACACVCKPNCGGCTTGQICNTSTCQCQGGVN